MALAGRSSRRGGGRRWIVVLLVLTIVVVLVDASTKSASQAPARTLAGQAWYDRVRPLIDASDVSGRQLAALRASTTSVTAAALDAQLQTLVSGTAATLRSYQQLRAPASMQGEAGLLETSLLVRSEATAALARAVRAELSAPATAAGTAQVTAVTQAAEQLQVADAAYKLFAAGLPSSLGVRAPSSVWVGDPALFASTGLQVWLAALHSRVSLAPLHRVAIVAVSTDPAPIDRRGSLQVLTPSSQLVVTVVVGDTGNQPESNLTVTVAISLSTGTSSVRDFVNLQPGSAQAITFQALTPVLGRPVQLAVTLTPAAGSPTASQTSTLTFEMPSATSSSTSTSSVAGGSTTTTTTGGGPGTTTGSSTTSVPDTTTTTIPTNPSPGG